MFAPKRETNVRANLVAAAFVALAFSAEAQGPNSSSVNSTDEQAGDRMAEILFMVPHDRIAEAGSSTALNDPRIIVANDGAQTTITAGCEVSCASIHVVLQAPGLPTISASSDRPDKLIFAVPAAYTHAISNYGFQLSFRCRNNALTCTHQWAVLKHGHGLTLRSRGLPAAPSDAEWRAAAAPSGHLQWAARPSGDDLPYFYPLRALRMGQAGSAQLHCLANASGVLRCRAVDETPAGAGFGDAAVRMATLLRVQDTDASGQSVLNRQIVVPVRFEPPATN
jgi:hypothetical protein